MADGHVQTWCLCQMQDRVAERGQRDVCMYIKDFILRNLVLIFATHRATDSPCFTMAFEQRN